MKLSSKDIIDRLEAGREHHISEFAKQIIQNKLVATLFKLSIDKDPIISNRAIWILWHCSLIDYASVKPFLNRLIIHLNNKNIPSGVIRSVLSLFQSEPVPVKYHSFMLDKCFGYITNSAEAIAVRAFAITVAFNISKNYPELLQELETILGHLPIHEESPGIRTRTKNTLKLIQKHKQNLKR